MTEKKGEIGSRTPDQEPLESSRGKLSRREFAKTSILAGAVVAMPSVLRAEPQSDAEPETKLPASTGTAGASAGASSGSTGWRAGTTIPSEYYYDAEHYKKDERYVGDHFWLLADHVSRIPESGDYFVFKYGLGESVIVVRDGSGDIRAFNNVCRHRGSRLCRHDEDPRPSDERLSVRQLGESGNAQVFRCPYHAWLYDLDGSLMDAYEVHDDFDMAANGLIPCHVRVEEGHIFLNFSRAEKPPEFGGDFEWSFDEVGASHRLADLKIAARQYYPIHANWKLAIENFLECYHCGPSHKSLVTTHNWDYTLTSSQKKRRAKEIRALLGTDPDEAQGMGSGAGPFVGELNPGFVTGSLDGKPVAPLLPGISDWTHKTDIATTGYSTGYWQAYDDHVAVARFTPRGPEFTDCEIFWLVHPDAVEGKDYIAENVMALWDITIREDIWIVENNHSGIKSGAYSPGRYSKNEDSPSEFITWYMNEVVQA
jgi:phenylpropionate dioxygenase-like ring-hydroxylating dioxygenase large terminal subunit